MSQPQYFHFTLGPVQGFVAQARRTRDFWAGSFILSWLSAVAMKSVMVQNGIILFPEADPEFLSWLAGNPKGKKPVQGSVPNRFKAKIGADIIETFDPQQVEIDIQTAWRALAELVYQQDLQAYVDKHNHAKTRDIWKRQIDHFWEISWAITDDIKDSALLDQRKNWRSHLPPDEPGVKCMMMDGLQELSGTSTPHGEGLALFWEPILKQGKSGIKSDLRKQEHLCTIAFIKRRFVRYFSKLNQSMQGGWNLRGWDLKPGVPSVTYMAAVHWLETALAEAGADQLVAFHESSRKLTDGYGEWETQIKCIERAWGDDEWKALDGNVFFRTLLENETLYKNQSQAQAVIRALADLSKSADLEDVSPFYAILMMDGDSLGKQMSDRDKQALITQGLAKFTQQVPGIVYAHNGFLIYAGGDDVLAILPLEDAMPCAVALRSLYQACFSSDTVTTSLSGAIEYAHIKMPLTRILNDAHDLLDHVAKDGCGRDAIAVRVWKPGGLALEWAQPWETALKGGTGMELERLAAELRSDDERSGQFSSQFFYKIRQRFELLNPDKQADQAILDTDEAIALMAAEYVSSGLCDQHYIGIQKIRHAEAVIRPLLGQCRPVYRDIERYGEHETHWPRSSNLQVDGALLVRFLAHKGVER